LLAAGQRRKTPPPAPADSAPSSSPGLPEGYGQNVRQAA
jgi:hypothetical protein